MRRNGSITAHSREWPLYEEHVEELWARGSVEPRFRMVAVLSQPSEDRAEKESLDEPVSYSWE